MGITLRALVLGVALLSAPSLLTLPAPWIAALAILAGLVCAAAFEGRSDGLTVAAGALGALVLVALAEIPSLAGGAFVALASAPRALRVTDRRAAALHVALGLCGGALAATVVNRWGGDAQASVRAATLVVAGLLASLPTLVPADDRVAHALDALARELHGDVSGTLSRAASLRRRVARSELLTQLPGEALARVDAGWSSLLHTADRRAALGPELAAGAALVDQRIVAHVEVLERVYAAASERAARTLGLDDRGIDGARLEREGIEAEVRALAELAGPPSA